MFQTGHHIKKNDLVQIISGKEKGKTGKVINVWVEEGKVILEKLNLSKRHVKPSKKNPQGGITEVEKPLEASNVLLVCSKCKKGVRTGKKVVKDKKLRVCKKCGEVLDK
ncbi:MAG: 50S ribosomal protein L24 [Deltaproteobacteria bacterium GWA2_38_16]|nr:MAG: 50S ribosomal protein L24 [Deltaproteobacteria bacterium GWA2_38_16]OGQ03794.1 MAG: 50S ribosomal protein L24 [Deltaproteobacteria bacterium RIFCSPHIGHO2_02_FULL_38_15]OGQ34312.1 MAG: 50S ribosomal protein L24 [Deltaproteobacteria bacterium RIFCSPLOWO2_01_FULL_38_9]OGQ59142.1 MAG: 50S ribosomal protein L24 [Deltaproteobacteria bacterium RIFCSPLOWO2_12_FULL_38_8]HBQ20833.1 50S ribosomal protein L24 [Deltaproteobacteria bacterium]